MPDGTGLIEFSRRFPDRFFDVGIAEEHAVSFAAGLALGGLVPVVAIYSSFLQRAVDQILHDVCMQNLHVIFAIDRAGLVGADGETHQGCFDLSYLSMMPNMTVLAPKNDKELEEMLAFAVDCDGPVAIRYPRGSAYQGLQEHQAPVEHGKSEVIHRGKKIAVLGVGSMIPSCLEVCKGLKEDGFDPTFVNVRFVKPLDVKLLDELAKDHSLFATVEENVKSGGYGEHVSAYMEACHPEVRVLSASVWDRFVPQGNVDSLRARIGLGVADIRQAIEDSEELKRQ
jgi:1-deoxy-D-xylulose-5-phosphate synthase